MEKPDACNSTDSCIGDCTSDGVCSRCRFNSDRGRAAVPEADTTVKDEVSTPEAKAITVDVATSSTTFDGTQDIVITYTINGAPEGLEPYGDIPNFGGVTGVHKEKVSDTVYRCTIPVSVQQKLIERDHPTDGQTYDLYSGYSI